MICLDAQETPAGARADQPVLITGGAGFIGSNLASALLETGARVRIFDSLSRNGVRQNLDWLCARYGERVEVEIADIREPESVRRAVDGVGAVFHLAAQVAVTTSMADPTTDFDVNAGGTLHLLEALRERALPVPLVYTSTNKVYGALDDVALVRNQNRYEPSEPSLREQGIAENRPLDFYSPYGCSKGSADQYVLDYARVYGLPTCVFRMSCIYGPHQCGNEDQGWVAHLMKESLAGRPITIFGDGRQVRDVLFVTDLVDALRLASRRMDVCAGRAFNLGGGAARALSILDLIGMIEGLCRISVKVAFGRWRPGDQRYYVSDCRQFRRATGWEPSVGVFDGLSRLRDWMQNNQESSSPCTESYLPSNR